MKKILIILLAFVSSCASSSNSTGTTVQNPILESGADPWVTLVDGKYYYCCSANNSICISVSDKPYVINPPIKVWSPEPDNWNRSCLWAPELHHLEGKWYVYYAAGESGPPYIHQRSGVLESVGDDPLGEWVEKSILFTGEGEENIWAIDLTVFEHQGKFYGVWSGWEKNEPTDATQQNLYIAQMSNPWTISSPRVLISAPEAAYEIIDDLLPINEGPEVLKSDKDVFIVYSCGQSWLPTYKLSWLKLKDSEADPLDPNSWIKSKKAVMEGTDKVFGVGHASFTTSVDGQRHYIIYHTKKEAASGWNRAVHIQRFDFDQNGEPVFGEPSPAGESVVL